MHAALSFTLENPSCSDILHGVQSYAEICGLAALSLLLMVDRSQCCKHFFCSGSHCSVHTDVYHLLEQKIDKRELDRRGIRHCLNYAGDGSLSHREGSAKVTVIKKDQLKSLSLNKKSALKSIRKSKILFFFLGILHYLL